VRQLWARRTPPSPLRRSNLEPPCRNMAQSSDARCGTTRPISHTHPFDVCVSTAARDRIPVVSRSAMEPEQAGMRVERSERRRGRGEPERTSVAAATTAPHSPLAPPASAQAAPARCRRGAHLFESLTPSAPGARPDLCRRVLNLRNAAKVDRCLSIV
jgi:hypothetical protein